MPKNAPQVLVTPRRSALLAGHDNQVDVLIRIQGPDENPRRTEKRPPYHLALVVDRSGSMRGAPLAEAVRCTAYIIDRLDPEDRVSLVQFDNRVELLAPPTPAKQKSHLWQLLGTIRPGGNTNLHGGWDEGARSIEKLVQDAALSRVILLSDGNANEGITDVAAIVEQCAAMAGKGVSTSTYGLGRDFNEELMVSMAQAGQGNHYYGETAADLMEPFAEEFDLIANLYARGVRLSIAATEGVEFRLLNDYRPVAGEQIPTWQLPDVAYASEAWALVSLRVPARLTEKGEVTLLQIAVTGSDLDGKPIAFADQSFALPILDAAAFGAIAEDELVARRKREIEAAQLLDRARHAANNYDWEGVDRILAEAESAAASNPWLAEVIESIRVIAQSQDRAYFTKEALYSAGKLSRRLSAKDEVLMMSEESAKAAYLRRKTSQGKAQFRPEDGK